MPDLIPPPEDAPLSDWVEYLKEALRQNKRIRLPKSVWLRLQRWRWWTRYRWTLSGPGWTAAAATFMVAAIALMAYRWWWAAHPEALDLGESGPPCGSTPEAKALESHDREVTGESYLGYQAALRDAIAAARKDAETINVNCGGDCPAGQKCAPAVSIQNIEASSTFPYIKTYLTLTYRLRCECVPAK